MATSEHNPICRCLGITESEIRAAADFAGCETISEIKETTEAGTGCTACHKRILKLLVEARQQNHSPAASPT
jgi:NAD(P)H-nitrite reductase large subunit